MASTALHLVPSILPAVSTLEYYTQKKRAVGYLRVSTPGQTGNNHSSLETQESRYKEHCQRYDLIPVCHVVSGRRDDRKEYRRMVEYAIQGNADVIIVQFLDRFGRNPKEILQRY